MRKQILISLASCICFCCLTLYGQQKEAKDACSDTRFMALLNEAPTITATDVRTLPQCVHDKFIRLVGIYRVSFENSDFYDPTGEGGRTWITFDSFYSAVKRCSDPQALRLLEHKNGGTFGFVAMGIFHGPEPSKNVDPRLPEAIRKSLERTSIGYGHLNSWPNEFEVICVEKIVLFSGNGSLFEFQKPDVRKRILSWYAKDHSP